MYAADRTIRSILPQLDFEARFPDAPFEESVQIQPCSIDLRLDTRFWIARKIPRPPGLKFWRRPVLDLRKRRLFEISPRRRWRRIELRPGECIDLKPNQILLGRTYEKFTIPQAFAGKIEGRSSYARLGLMIHCSGDFINPGYRGHMPIELVSFANTPLRLQPLMPIAQLILVRLTETPERLYGHKDLDSKYLEDDGGPSFWWRDKLFSSLAERFGEQNMSSPLNAAVMDLLPTDTSVEVLERLDCFIEKQPVGRIESGLELMTSFAEREDRRRLASQLIRGTLLAAASILCSATIGAFYVSKIGWGHYLLWGATLISIGAAWSAFWLKSGASYGTAELQRFMKGETSP